MAKIAGFFVTKNTVFQMTIDKKLGLIPEQTSTDDQDQKKDGSAA